MKMFLEGQDEEKCYILEPHEFRGTTNSSTPTKAVSVSMTLQHIFATHNRRLSVER
jgi:hypothetical protein